MQHVFENNFEYCYMVCFSLATETKKATKTIIIEKYIVIFLAMCNCYLKLLSLVRTSINDLVSSSTNSKRIKQWLYFKINWNIFLNKYSSSKLHNMYVAYHISISRDTHSILIYSDSVISRRLKTEVRQYRLNSYKAINLE